MVLACFKLVVHISAVYNKRMQTFKRNVQHAKYELCHVWATI